MRGRILPIKKFMHLILRLYHLNFGLLYRPYSIHLYLIFPALNITYRGEFYLSQFTHQIFYPYYPADFTIHTLNISCGGDRFIKKFHSSCPQYLMWERATYQGVYVSDFLALLLELPKILKLSTAYEI